jgi:hypothetical protein
MLQLLHITTTTKHWLLEYVSLNFSGQEQSGRRHEILNKPRTQRAGSVQKKFWQNDTVAIFIIIW